MVLPTAYSGTCQHPHGNVIMEILENVNGDDEDHAGGYATFEHWRIKINFVIGHIKKQG